ncbi:Asg7p LALA0_S11e03994g [Lachancea lanzarotensis]|uniref:LALA0S11e03994g1_1 n=1 Tax=Lachancea lanzarotensis TaxID=1245769 RepID=A0A0C7N953_9SACH|nr:uncharacterized protein LALA0_S11e03994g [Lachancea lanzarotensis]CEP64433.1 LALA0S11e03994g1_1 [Lachancea lanzarotensis]
MSATESLTVVEYALPPFEEYTKTYSCQCKSCLLCEKTQFWMPRLFFAGFIFPVCWILVVAIFAYTCFAVPHDFELPPITDDEQPTLFELEMHRKCICKAKEVSPDKRILPNENNKNDSSPPPNRLDTPLSRSRPNTARLSQILASARSDYIHSVASDVIQWHTKLYKFRLNWALRAGLSSVCYITVILFLVLTFRSSRKMPRKP